MGCEHAYMGYEHAYMGCEHAHCSEMLTVFKHISR